MKFFHTVTAPHHAYREVGCEVSIIFKYVTFRLSYFVKIIFLLYPIICCETCRMIMKCGTDMYGNKGLGP